MMKKTNDTPSKGNMKLTLPIASSLIFTFIAILTLWMTGVNPYNLLMALWWPLLSLIQVCALLWYFTSIPFKYLLISLGLGASAIPLITYLIQKPLNILLGGSSLERLLSDLNMLGTIDLQGPLIAPITEEITKMIPVLLILLLFNRRKVYRLLGPLDYALLGLASGVGFEIFENLCRVYNGYFDTIGLYRMSVNEPLPSLIGIHLFPTMIKSEYMGNPIIWFGHGGLTAAISLALGFAMYLKKWRYAVLPIATYVICAFDHSMWNWYQPYPEQLWAKVLPPLTLYGRLIPILFLAGILFSIQLVWKEKVRFKTELGQMNTTGDPVYVRIKKKNQLVHALRHYVKHGIKGEPFDVVVGEIIGK